MEWILYAMQDITIRTNGGTLIMKLIKAYNQVV